MRTSEIVQTLMFDYVDLAEKEIIEMCKSLPAKIVRWMGIHHPDNRTRRLFYELTGVVIGKDTVININFVISDGYLSLLKIGERVAISPNVTVICQSDVNNSNLKEIGYVKDNLICEKHVVIGDDVWIGANSIILPGVTIGAGAIIGAGAVVAGNVSAYTVVAGTPAKPVRGLNASLMGDE